MNAEIQAVLDGESDGVIITGDCLEIMADMPDGCVDAVVTDPPYALPTVVAQGRVITRNIGDLSIVERGLSVYLNQCARVFGQSGRLMVFCDGTSYPVVFRCLYSQLSLALLVWDKGRIGMGREFRKSHELICHAWAAETPVFADGKGRADILRCSPVGYEREHPAQKPVALLKELLAVAGDIILDPFCGSGTTCVAAKKLGRRYIGIEISPKYAEIARNRVRNTPKPLFTEPAEKPEQAELFAEKP